MEFTLSPLGDGAIIIKIGDTIEPDSRLKIQSITSALDASAPTWLTEYIPAFTTVTVFYNLMNFNSKHPYDAACYELSHILRELRINSECEKFLVEIPVYYGNEFGPDLKYVADYNSLTIDEVIRIHTEAVYEVNMIGFAPGFPFLSGMSEKIAVPRKSSPRLSVPARSVGIAGLQTGIYPIETPGGWQIIGRTPTPLFRPDEEIPSLLHAGNKVKFNRISLQEYMQLEVVDE